MPPPASGTRGPAGNASANNAPSGNAPLGSSWRNERQARGPMIAPDDPSLMNIPRSRPEVLSFDDTRLPPRIEAPQLAPPSPAGPVPRDRSVTGVVRNGLTAGVAFLANRDGSVDAAGAPGESIVVRAARAYEGELRTGLRALLVVGGLAGGWMTLVPLSGAVVVPGNLVVQSNVKTIQHPTGGVVAQIPVHNGMRVNAGDLLLRLELDAGAGQPSGGQQATRRSAGEDLTAGRRARRLAPAGGTGRDVGSAGRQRCQDAACFGGVAVQGAGDGTREVRGNCSRARYRSLATRSWAWTRRSHPRPSSWN